MLCLPASQINKTNLREKKNNTKKQRIKRIKGTEGCDMCPSKPDASPGAVAVEADGNMRWERESAQCGLWDGAPQLLTTAGLSSGPGPSTGRRGGWEVTSGPLLSPLPADSCWDFRAKSSPGGRGGLGAVGRLTGVISVLGCQLLKSQDAWDAGLTVPRPQPFTQIPVKPGTRVEGAERGSAC